MRVAKPRSPSSGRTASDDAASHERITVRPPFDPEDFARQSERLTMRPAAGPSSDVPELTATPVFDDPVPLQDTSIPELAVSRDDLAWFDLPPAARTVLDHVDGETSIEMICVRVGLPLTEGMDALDALVRDGLVVCR